MIKPGMKRNSVREENLYITLSCALLLRSRGLVMYCRYKPRLAYTAFGDLEASAITFFSCDL